MSVITTPATNLLDTRDSVLPLQLSRFIGHANVHYDLDGHAQLITDDHVGNMAALGAMAGPASVRNVVPLQRRGQLQGSVPLAERSIGAPLPDRPQSIHRDLIRFRIWRGQRLRVSR
jgi:hypothetical protein